MNQFFEALKQKEVKLQRWLRRNHGNILEPFAVAVHYACREVGLTAALGFFFCTGHWTWATSTFFTLDTGEILNGFLKFSTKEPRPLWVEDVAPALKSTATGTWEKDYSFPSSHAMVTLCIALAIGKGLGFDSFWTWLAIIVAALTGLTRGYLGQHYFHDVVAGWIIELIIFFPLWSIITNLSESMSVTQGFMMMIILAYSPYILEFAKAVFPDHSAQQIKEWESHAQQLSGKRDKKLVTRNSKGYFVLSCSAASCLFSLTLAKHNKDLYDAAEIVCVSFFTWRYFFTCLLFTVLFFASTGIPLVHGGFDGKLRPLNIVWVPCILFGSILTPIIVRYIVGCDIISHK